MQPEALLIVPEELPPLCDECAAGLLDIFYDLAAALDSHYRMQITRHHERQRELYRELPQQLPERSNHDARQSDLFEQTDPPF